MHPYYVIKAHEKPLFLSDIDGYLDVAFFQELIDWRNNTEFGQKARVEAKHCNGNQNDFGSGGTRNKFAKYHRGFPTICPTT